MKNFNDSKNNRIENQNNQEQSLLKIMNGYK